MKARPCQVPDSRGTAAQPGQTGAALPLRAPSSGISASRPAAVVAAIPGMEVRISNLRARASSAAISVCNLRRWRAGGARTC